jgi:integrase
MCPPENTSARSKGGRPAGGTVEWRKDEDGRWRWHARISRLNGKRPWVALDPAIPEDDKPAAKVCASETSAYFRAKDLEDADLRTTSATTGESATKWFARFHARKEAKGLVSVKDMRARVAKWVLPGIAEKPMGGITREDLEAVVKRLDVAVAAFQQDGPGKGRLSPSTAANVWGHVQHAFSEACNAKDPGLRVLKSNPAEHVRGPETGAEREGQILYSAEVVALLTGAATTVNKLDVPLYRRRCYAMAIYTKARSSELEALMPKDVDLVNGTITISKQVDRESKGRKGTRKTKTKSVRTIDIEPHLRPLVEDLVKHPTGKGGRLLHMPPTEDRAELLRKDLKAVGVTREALFVEHDPLRRAIVFHELRDTGLVHMAVRGDSPIVIQWAGGHTDFKTTQGYLDRGRVEARRIGAPLPPLPPGLIPPPKRGPRVSSEVSSLDDHSDEPLDISDTYWRPQRELNPCYRRERPVS